MNEDSFLGGATTLEAVQYSNEQLTAYAAFHHFKKYPCAVKPLWRDPQPLFPAIALPKYSPLRPYFKQIIQKIRQNGIMHYMLMKWDAKDVLHEMCKIKPSTERISLYETVSLFSFLTCGIQLSFVIFLPSYFLSTKISVSNIFFRGFCLNLIVDMPCS